MAKRVWVRVARHCPKLLRTQATHGRQRIDEDIAVFLSDAAHEIVNKAKLVIYEVVNIGRHQEIEADATLLGVVCEPLELLLHCDEARRVRIVNAAIMGDEIVFAGFVEEAMVGNPERNSQLAVTQKDVASAGRKVFGV